MKTISLIALALGVAVIVAVVVSLQLRTPHATPEPVHEPTHPPPLTTPTAELPASSNVSHFQRVPVDWTAPPPTNKLQRLNHVRESFRALSRGDAAMAMRAARQLSNDNERETALLTLVTEWTGGELSPTSQRARAVTVFGLEGGLGLELVKNPDLALLWANELTEGQGRANLLRELALFMGSSDPEAALALGAQLPESERSYFSRAVLTGWAVNDTAAALEYAGQLPEQADREGSLMAIREVAPVGIGAELRTENGYSFVNRLLPGAPAELSGQLHPGDRIVGVAQGDSSFVDARTLSLGEVVQMIRGAPGTRLQLQVLPANASADSAPRTISILRDQIKFKK